MASEGRKKLPFASDRTDTPTPRYHGSRRDRRKVAARSDRAALASYCAAYALWAEATQAIQTYGAMVKIADGLPIQSPYVSIANRQTEIMMRIASECGLTPASRSRIGAPAAAQPSLFDQPAIQKDDTI